jgi:hypothetical protein
MESCPGGAVLQRPAREKVALVSRVSKSRASHGVGACDRMRSQIFMVNRSPFMFLCLAKDSACSPTLPAFTGRVESVHRSVPSRRLMVPAPLQPRQKRGCPGRWFRNGTADLLEVCDVKDQVGFPHASHPADLAVDGEKAANGNPMGPHQRFALSVQMHCVHM